MLRRMLAAVAVVAMAMILLACGGGGEEEGQIAPTASPQVSPTAMPTVAAARRSPRAAQSTPEEYRAAMSPLVSEGQQIFHGAWREILSTTEPPESDAYREAVAAKIDALRVRIQMIEAPDDWAVSHALMVDSLRQAANGMRGEGKAHTTGDVQALAVAVEEQADAIDGWDEAVRQMPLLELAAVATPIETPTSSEEYRAKMVSLLPDVTQIFSVEWPEALGKEPLGDEAWQEAVDALAAKIDGLRVRIEMMEAPEDFAVSHALMVDSLSKTAEAVREVRIAVTNGDTQGVKDALADVQNAMAIWHEAMEQVPAP